MSSIYISSKKRLDSRWLWLFGLIMLVLIAGVGYLVVTSYLTPKNSQNSQVKSSQSTASSSLANLNSSQNQSNPMTADAQKAEAKPESPSSTSSASVMSEPTADAKPKSDPMPATNNQTASDIMVSTAPTKPTLSMDEILNQTKNAQSVGK